jgi:hypothetical protein
MMKKILFFLFTVCIFISCKTEKEEEIPSGFDHFYDLHANDKNVITIGIPKFIFKLFVDIPNREIEEAVDAIETIDLIILNQPDSGLVTELYAEFPIKYYKPILSVQNEQGKIKFLAKEKKKKADELIMIVEQETENNCVLMRIGGSFNIKALEKLAEKIDVREIVKYR